MKKFSKEFNGYNKEEVNAFLNDVIIQTEKVLQKLEKQQTEISSLNTPVAWLTSSSVGATELSPP